MLGDTWRNFDIAAASIRRLLFSFDMRKRSSGGEGRRRQRATQKDDRARFGTRAKLCREEHERTFRNLFTTCFAFSFFQLLDLHVGGRGRISSSSVSTAAPGSQSEEKVFRKNHFNIMPTIQTPTSRRSEPLQPVKGDGGRLWQLQLPRRRPQGGGHSQRARPCRR